MANSVIGAYRRNVVGHGYTLRARTSNETLNKQIIRFPLISLLSPVKYCDVAIVQKARCTSCDLCHKVVLNLVAYNQSAEQTDRYSRDTIRARARDLERNSDMANSVIGAVAIVQKARCTSCDLCHKVVLNLV